MNLARLFARAPCVYLLFIVNVLLFLVELSRGVSPLKPSAGDMIAWGANVAALTLTGDAWRLLSSMFLHIGLLHITLNMYMLLALGPLAEHRFGSARYALVYLLSGLCGSLLSATYHGGPGKIMVAAGASGALMGIAGAFVGHWIVSGARDAGQEREIMRGPLILTIGINLALGLIIPGVDNACHLGGLISGAILGAGFTLCDFEHSKLKRSAASVLITVASLGLIYLALQKPPSAQLLQTGKQIRARQDALAREEQRRLKQLQIRKEMEGDRKHAAPTVSNANTRGQMVAAASMGQRLYLPATKKTRAM